MEETLKAITMLVHAAHHIGDLPEYEDGVCNELQAAWDVLRDAVDNVLADEF